MKQVAGLQRVTALLANSYTQKRVAQIILKEGLSVLGATNGEIVMIGHDGNLYALAHTGYPLDFIKKYGSRPKDTPLLTEEVVKTKRPLFITSTRLIGNEYKAARSFLTASGAQSAAFLPLIVKRKIIGVMLFTFTKTQKFTYGTRLFLLTLTNQCALAFERVAALESLKASRKELEIILKNTADGIIVEDRDGKCVFINESAMQLLGIPGKRQKRVVLSEELKKFDIEDEQGKKQSKIHKIDNAFFRGKGKAQTTLKLVNKKAGDIHWITIRSAPIIPNRSDALVVNTIHDITEIKELDLRKDDFISMTSHELKTPLTSMKLFLNVLYAQLEKEKEYKSLSYVTKIQEQAERLQKHVTDLLDISRIRQGKLSFNKTRFSLDALICDTVEELQLNNPTRKISFRVKSPLEVYGDKFRLHQVIANLVGNAIKYSPNGKRISVSLKKEGKNAVAAVRDFGIGISKKEQEKIFERFYQTEHAKQKSDSGLGMGLFIAQEIIKRHKGKLWVKSQEQKGSTFSFSIPIDSAK